MDVTDAANAHVQKQHDMVKRTNRALLGEDKYESKYGKFDRLVVSKNPYGSSKDRKPSVDAYSRQDDENDIVDHYYDSDDYYRLLSEKWNQAIFTSAQSNRVQISIFLA